jgi:hypothetical protein
MTTASDNDKNTAMLLNDGLVLIAGAPLTGELYNPATGTFTAAGNPAAPMFFNTPTLLANGRILFAYYGTSQIYDPRTGMFSLTGATSGFETQATLLTNGKVLVTGGNQDPGPDTLAELHDPSAGTFSFTGNLTASRAFHTSSLLSDGRVLIAGGSSFVDSTDLMFHSCLPISYPCLASAELYDAATGLFLSTGSMTAARAGHTATLLNNGAVLIAGGGGNASAAAELYDPEVAIPPPVLFSLSGDGRGQGIVWHATTGQLASSSNPAVAGEALAMYTTSLVNGAVIPPQVEIGGRLAEILFFGGAPGYPGYYQVNFRVPSGVAPGSAVPERLTYLGRSSNAVTIGVR